MKFFKLASLVAVSAAFLCAQEAAVVRVSEAEVKKAVASRTDPEYPTMAKQMHLAGRVIVDVYLDADGKVEKVQPVAGNQLLTSAAVTAVKKWKFNSFQKKVVAAIAFDFKL